MVILGIDPGIALTGFGCIEADKEHCEVLDYGCIVTTPKQPKEERLTTIHSKLLEILDRYRPAVVVVERLFFGRNVSTALTVGEARGVVLLACGQRQVPTVEYTPMIVKQALVGHGKATKSQVEDCVMMELGLQKAPKPDDVSDALAIALTHVFLG
ncbi:MAG: crossover junction endodeoxyribonuclease RuvC [Candidatus Xenobia bacterium]